MARILPVPYKSQWDDDAQRGIDDCGPACVAMLLNHFGVAVGTNGIFDATGAGPQDLITMDQMSQAAEYFELALEYLEGRTLDDLRRWLDEGRPVIALVQYSAWSDRELTQDDYKGPHFVVVVGYDDAGHVLINDPDYWEPRRGDGDHKPYTAELFRQAWYALPPDENPSVAVLVPSAPLPAQPSLSVFGPATISRASFCERLSAAGSPLSGREADLAYAMSLAYGIDPAFPLALFFHASQFGTQGDTLTTRNPGLLKSGSDGVNIGLELPERGRLQRYHAWLDGWRAMLNHLIVRHQARGRATVAQVLPAWDIEVDAGGAIEAVELSMREMAEE